MRNLAAHTAVYGLHALAKLCLRVEVTARFTVINY